MPHSKSQLPTTITNKKVPGQHLCVPTKLVILTSKTLLKGLMVNISFVGAQRYSLVLSLFVMVVYLELKEHYSFHSNLPIL